MIVLACVVVLIAVALWVATGRQAKRSDVEPHTIPSSVSGESTESSPASVPPPAPTDTDGVLLVTLPSNAVIPVDQLRAFVRGCVAFLDHSTFESKWSQFHEVLEQNFDGPRFDGAFVELFSDQIFWVDWKASEEVEFQAKQLITAIGIDGDFAWDYKTATETYMADERGGITPVAAGMRSFQSWLQERGYDLVGLDFHWDAYIAVVVSDALEFKQLAAQAGIRTDDVDNLG